MAKKPKLALIPSGYKVNKVYSVLPSDGVGDFDFSRSGQATRINKDGLIETVGSNIPRLNYPMIDGVVSGCPSLLLEPARTNLEANSSEFTGGLIGVSILRDAEPSPDGTISADKLSDNSANGEHLINSSIALSMVSGTSYTVSAFFKSDGTGGQGVIRYWNGSAYQNGVFNLDNGDVSYNSYGTSKIKVYPNGWYRCSISFTAAGTLSNPAFQIGVANASNQFSYQGASNLSHYFWGVQYEVGSFISSYIPTTNSAVTRSAETANGAGDAATFNDSEGVLMAEISALANDGTNRVISLSDGTINNRLYLFYSSSSNSINTLLRVAGVGQFPDLTHTFSDITNFSKIAYKFSSTEFSLWANGIKVDSISGSFNVWGANVINNLSFDGLTFEKFYGNTKQIQYFNTALNDSDLETLTSWDSFSDMATSQLYTIE